MVKLKLLHSFGCLDIQGVLVWTFNDREVVLQEIVDLQLVFNGVSELMITSMHAYVSDMLLKNLLDIMSIGIGRPGPG